MFSVCQPYVRYPPFFFCYYGYSTFMVGTVLEMVDCRKWNMPFPEMRRLDHYQDGTESVAGNGAPDTGNTCFQVWLGALPETSWPMPAMVHFLHDGARTLPETTRPMLAMVSFPGNGLLLVAWHSMYCCFGGFIVCCNAVPCVVLETARHGATC